MVGVTSAEQDAEEKEEEEEADGMMMGPSLPPTQWPALDQPQEEPSPPLPPQPSAKPVQPVELAHPPPVVPAQQDRETHQPEGSGLGVARAASEADKKKEMYFGPTADYLGSQKGDEPMVMPPPMPRYNKVRVGEGG